MRYVLPMLLGISVAAIMSSCNFDTFERHPLTISQTDVSTGNAEISKDRSCVDIQIQGRRLLLRPFYVSKFNTGLMLQSDGDKSFSIKRLRVTVSSVSAEEAIRGEAQAKGGSPFSQYYYRIAGMGHEGELTSPLVVPSKCEIGLRDTSIEKAPKFYVFSMELECGGFSNEIRIVAHGAI